MVKSVSTFQAEALFKEGYKLDLIEQQMKPVDYSSKGELKLFSQTTV